MSQENIFPTEENVEKDKFTFDVLKVRNGLTTEFGMGSGVPHSL